MVIYRGLWIICFARKVQMGIKWDLTSSNFLKWKHQSCLLKKKMLLLLFADDILQCIRGQSWHSKPMSQPSPARRLTGATVSNVLLCWLSLNQRSAHSTRQSQPGVPSQAVSFNELRSVTVECLRSVVVLQLIEFNQHVCCPKASNVLKDLESF